MFFGIRQSPIVVHDKAERTEESIIRYPDPPPRRLYGWVAGRIPLPKCPIRVVDDQIQVGLELLTSIQKASTHPSRLAS